MFTAEPEGVCDSPAHGGKHDDRPIDRPRPRTQTQTQSPRRAPPRTTRWPRSWAGCPWRSCASLSSSTAGSASRCGWVGSPRRSGGSPAPTRPAPRRTAPCWRPRGPRRRGHRLGDLGRWHQRGRAGPGAGQRPRRPARAAHAVGRAGKHGTAAALTVPGTADLDAARRRLLPPGAAPRDADAGQPVRAARRAGADRPDADHDAADRRPGRHRRRLRRADPRADPRRHLPLLQHRRRRRARAPVRENLFGAEKIEHAAQALALAARCTASFPFAFEPAFVPVQEPPGTVTPEVGPDMAAFASWTSLAGGPARRAPVPLRGRRRPAGQHAGEGGAPRDRAAARRRPGAPHDADGLPARAAGRDRAGRLRRAATLRSRVAVQRARRADGPGVAQLRRPGRRAQPQGGRVAGEPRAAPHRLQPGRSGRGAVHAAGHRLAALPPRPGQARSARPGGHGRPTAPVVLRPGPRRGREGATVATSTPGATHEPGALPYVPAAFAWNVATWQTLHARHSRLGLG